MGESAWILRGLTPDPLTVCRALNATKILGLHTAVASYETVGLYVDAETFSLDSLILGDFVEVPPARTHIIPVCYDLGEDLKEVCDNLGLTPAEFVHLHCEPAYTCFAVGFCPGFPYLGWLPSAISGVPRRPSPRVRIVPGSVGITGKQTGIYPIVRPGGWPLVGRTPLTLVDVQAEFFPISAGDRVQFEPIDRSQFNNLEGQRL